MRERLLRHLLASMRCLACGHRYERDNINVVRQEEGRWLLRVYCASCSNWSLVAAEVKEDWDTELAEGAFRDEGPVTADDVLDMHGFLKDFQGDFASLFAPR